MKLARLYVTLHNKVGLNQNDTIHTYQILCTPFVHISIGIKTINDRPSLGNIFQSIVTLGDGKINDFN